MDPQVFWCVLPVVPRVLHVAWTLENGMRDELHWAHRRVDQKFFSVLTRRVQGAHACRGVLSDSGA